MFELTTRVRVYGVHEDAPDDGVVLEPYEVAAYPWWSETTRAVLEWMADANLAGARVLDFGCGGSAILALAAARVFGARSVECVENDERLVPIARRQLAANGIRRTVFRSVDAGKWDVALANVGDAHLVGEVSRLAKRGCGTDRDGSLITW